LEVSPGVIREAFPEATIAGVRLYDASARPQWVGVCLASYGIVYNPDLYSSLGMNEPKGWGDLTDERLAGLVALADPAHAGSAAVAYMVVLQRAMADAELKGVDKGSKEYQGVIAKGWKKGMSQLLLMAANARYFTASASQVPNDVSTGDAAAGVAIDFYGHVAEEAVGSNRCRFVLPEGATSITPDPVGVLMGVKGEKKILANRFVEFLLTPEAQRLWALKAGKPGGPVERALRRMPVRRDVYKDRKGWADDGDPFEQARGFNQRAEWMGLFGDTRAVWVAAWIDAREELQGAYRAILRVADRERREKFLEKLADLPVELGEIDLLRRQRMAIEAAHGDIDLWRARQRIDWAERFREHYRGVAREAK